MSYLRIFNDFKENDLTLGYHQSINILRLLRNCHIEHIYHESLNNECMEPLRYSGNMHQRYAH